MPYFKVILLVLVSVCAAGSAYAQTPVLIDINSGAGDSSPRNLADIDGTLFFRADDGVNGSELWKSDGTTAGTIMVKDINTTGDSAPSRFTDVNGTLFFRADNGVDGS